MKPDIYNCQNKTNTNRLQQIHVCFTAAEFRFFILSFFSRAVFFPFLPNILYQNIMFITNLSLFCLASCLLWSCVSKKKHLVSIVAINKFIDDNFKKKKHCLKLCNQGFALFKSLNWITVFTIILSPRWWHHFVNFLPMFLGNTGFIWIRILSSVLPCC